MQIDEYQREAARSCTWRKGDDYPLNMAALGLNEEAGEVAALIRKSNRDGANLDRRKMVDELGDVLWNVAQLAEILGVPLSEVAAANIAKQQRRHPDRYGLPVRLDRGDIGGSFDITSIPGYKPTRWVTTPDGVVPEDAIGQAPGPIGDGS